MSTEANQLQGFKLLSANQVEEIHSYVRHFIHEKSGAQLLHISNDDDNKVFSITFRTPPSNDTGLPHILEHSVLCGSRKYPVKEPFVELMKGSLNTFLNAMTFPDKTMYPVASRNEKDFFHLMDVYLDAVFFPQLLENPEILMQEGWHYDMTDPKDELTYKGVVYNEMKGAFSAPESILFRNIQNSLFPDTPYRYESGGDPRAIPQLTQEEFVAFHRRYYHPSNSFIILYGNGDLNEQLQYLDQNYLSQFDRIEVDSEITEQAAFKAPGKKVIDYPLSSDEDEQEKTLMSLNFVAGKATDPEQYLALQILEYLLLEMESSPLKRALIQADLGKDVFGSVDTSILQPVLSIVLKNTEEERAEQFQDVVFTTLRQLVKNGIDQRLIEAALNPFEFQLREADFKQYPKGLVYSLQVLDSWLYGGDPLAHLAYEPTLKKLKDGLGYRYFEQLIERVFLQNSHHSLLIVRPKKGLGEARNQELRAELAKRKAAMSQEEITRLIAETKKLQERQQTPDDPEALAKIPMVELKDVKREVEALAVHELKWQGNQVLYHSDMTNSILYLNFYFRCDQISAEAIPYLGLLTQVFGKMATERYSVEELSTETNLQTGRLDFNVQTFGQSGDATQFTPYFVIKTSVLKEKLPRLLELLDQILLHTKMSDERRLQEIIRETKSRIEMRIFDQGHRVVLGRLLSYYSPLGAYQEKVKGIEFYRFLLKLEREFSNHAKELTQQLAQVAEQLINRNQLLIQLTCEEQNLQEVESLVSQFTAGIHATPVTAQQNVALADVKNEGIMTAGDVQYVAKGFNFLKAGYSYQGQLLVLRSIMSTDYLWSRVRVQGGAYGAFLHLDRHGNFGFASYRDPNLSRTLKVYDEAAAYLRDFRIEDREMTKLILGTISRLDTPLTPSLKGDEIMDRYLRGISLEELQQEREQVLNTTQEEIRNLAPLVEKVLADAPYCVLGNRETIEEEGELFQQTFQLFA